MALTQTAAAGYYAMKARAKVLLLFGRANQADESYFGYEKAAPQPAT